LFGEKLLRSILPVAVMLSLESELCCAFWSPRALFEKVWRAMVEIGFIMFLFYSNLLMGEFEGSGLGQKVGFVGAKYEELLF
jgi:hypothetical protein